MISGRNRLGRLLSPLASHLPMIPRDLDYYLFPLTSRTKFQKQSEMAQNGSADASIEASSSPLPTVVGINYGNSYASIAVVSKARAHFFAVQNRVIAYPGCRRDWRTVLPTRMANVRLPLLSHFTAKKRYGFQCFNGCSNLTNNPQCSTSALEQNINL